MNICTLTECDSIVKARGLCGKHHEWSRRHPGEKIDYVGQRANEFHGMCGTPEYRTWLSMIERCTNPRAIGYKHYGGRGIAVCEAWRNSFQAFYSYMGSRPKGLTIDRIDMNKGYEPGNVRWATKQVQVRNRRINKSNKCGVTGVSWHNREKRWFAELYVNGLRVYSKSFTALNDAIVARHEAERLFIS